MINFVKAKKIIIDEIEVANLSSDYFECYISSSSSSNKHEQIIENVIHLFVRTTHGELEISGNFGTEIELRNLISNLLNSHAYKRKRINLDDNGITANIELLQSECQIINGVTSIFISKEFFNSEKISKSSKNQFFLDDKNSRRFLFCRKQIDELYEDLAEEEQFIKKSTTNMSDKTWIIAPRIVHKTISNTFSKLIFRGDEKLVKFYLSAFNTDIYFANLPISDESIYNGSFDLYGEDYFNKKYIYNGQYCGLGKNDARYEINNGNIKKGFQFSKLEINPIYAINKDFMFFYDFEGKIDINTDFIDGKLIGENMEKTVKMKLSSFFAAVIGSCGRMTNVIYIYAGNAPYAVLREI